MNIIDKSFVREPKKYLIQSLLAVAVVVIIFYFVDVLPHAVIVASLGGSSFIVFTMPNSVQAQPRRLIGGHIVGLICGSIFYFAFLTGRLGELSTDWGFITLLAYALSVGLCIFLMAITNTEHTPAVATALGIVTEGWSYQIVISVLVCAISLAIVRRLLRSRLKDLV